MPSKHIGEVRTDENAFILIQCFWGCGALSRQFVLIDLDCLIVLLKIKQTGITLTTDCSVGKGLAVWFRTGVLWVKFNALTRVYPLPPPPLQFASLFWFLCLFSSLNQKSVWKENSSRGWVVYILTSYLRAMTICLLWMPWNTWIIFCKKWNTS